MNSIERFRKETSDCVYAKVEEKNHIRTIGEMLEVGKRDYSDKVAVFDTKALTYAKLYDAVCNTVGFLDENNLGKKNIGIFIGNNCEFVRIALSVMASGRVAVLIPPMLDEKSLYGLLLKFDCQALIYQEELKEKVGFAHNLLSIPFFASNECIGKDNAHLPVLDRFTPACIILTGGTTGKPKGAVLSHNNLLVGAVNGLYGIVQPFGLTYYSLMPMTHVFGLIRNLLTCLISGGSLYFAQNMQAMFKEMAVVKPDILVLVPALAALILRVCESSGITATGGSLKVIICGGAVVPKNLVMGYYKLGVSLYPGYGLTESSNLVSGNPEFVKKPDSVGIPFPLQELKLVDGELWLKGENIMSGYYNDDEENKKAFCDGFFKTGDLAKFDDEGFLYIIGRSKNVIIMPDGENIYPEEIEKAVNDLDFVSDCLVYVEKNSFGQPVLALEILPKVALLQSRGVTDFLTYTKREVANVEGSVNYVKIDNIKIRTQDFARSPSMKIVRPKNDF
ncbi:MAG: class I adenylate-forming enzyme family protein [Clostridia bacterium]|nr:class I adenylate-forming enzyme family protein [Clostridia bacterium]